MANLEFYVSAPSPDLAATIAGGAIREFESNHPGVLLEPPDIGGGVEYNALRVGLSVRCDRPEESAALDAEFSRLLEKHRRANGLI